MSKNKNYYYIIKKYFIIITLVILVLLNFRIIMKNEAVEERVFSVIIMSSVWYFISLLFLIVFQVFGFSSKLDTNLKNKFNSYRFVWKSIVTGLIELLILNLVTLGAIAINFYLISTTFLKQSIDVLKLSGFSISKEGPLILIILFTTYALLLITIFLALAIEKKQSNRGKIGFVLSSIYFIMLSIINVFVINIAISNIYDYNLITISVILIKTILLIFLWYMLSSFLLEEKYPK